MKLDKNEWESLRAMLRSASKSDVDLALGIITSRLDEHTSSIYKSLILRAMRYQRKNNASKREWYLDRYYSIINDLTMSPEEIKTQILNKFHLRYEYT